MTQARKPKERLVRLPEVMARTGLVRAAIYVRMNEGTFPLSLKIGKSSVAWRESEIDAWIVATIAEAERQRERARKGETECAA
ncbi:prophage regulatory protein [Paraburkholderia sp. UCT70]|uniref:AlpA family phage regulatory protein n=1 Tax=Paraburkholderia sp. UCT70 TaxID=2991068 RepID=UPI003D212E0A